jgi:phosphoglycerate-specific signal transduction histidine kinase
MMPMLVVPRTRPAVDYLYSLYDALVSINVPSDKARAVVDAMERDMGTTLATKQDLLLIRQEIENRYTLLSREIDSLRDEVGKDLQSMRRDVAKDLEALRLSITLRLGSMLVVGFGVMLTALRLWL